MNDINFFAPYKGKVKKEDNSENSKKILIIAGSTAAVVIGVSFFINLFSILSIKSSIYDYEAKLNEESVVRKVKEAGNINNKLGIINQYDSSLLSIGTSIDKRDVVSNDILDSLSSTLPSDVYFKSFGIEAGSINVQAISKSRQAIGETEHNLRQLPNISDVYIGTIAGVGGDAVDGQYSFDIKITLKGAK